MVKRVLFVCTGNSCRSQIAEGFLRELGGGQFEVLSAGLQSSFVHPLTVAVMKEAGVDISTQHSKSITEVIGPPFDYVITLCDTARRICPTVPGEARRIHWSILDPISSTASGSGENKLKVFRKARDQIRKKIEEFIKKEGA